MGGRFPRLQQQDVFCLSEFCPDSSPAISKGTLYQRVGQAKWGEGQEWKSWQGEAAVWVLQAAVGFPVSRGGGLRAAPGNGSCWPTRWGAENSQWTQREEQPCLVQEARRETDPEKRTVEEAESCCTCWFCALTYQQLLKPRLTLKMSP